MLFSFRTPGPRACALLLLPAFLVGCSTLGFGQAAREQQTQDRLETIIADYFRLVQQNTKRNKQVLARVNFARGQIESGRLKFFIDHESKDPVLEGVSFTVIDRVRPVISIGAPVIAAYTERPGTVFSLLTNAFTHAHSFHHSRELFLSSLEGNELENYLFAKDAYFIEAMFIRDYLKPGGFSLSQFESYLLRSFTENNLAEFSFFLMGFDMNMTHRLYRMGRDAKQSPQEKMADMLEIGVKITRSLEKLQEAPPENVYRKLVPAVTYLSCMRHAQLDVPVSMKNGKMVPDKMAYQLRADLKEEMSAIHAKMRPFLPVYVSVKRGFYEKVARL